jgi:hypothetical protein
MYQYIPQFLTGEKYEAEPLLPLSFYEFSYYQLKLSLPKLHILHQPTKLQDSILRGASIAPMF